jgi:hypothetical protein
MVSTKATRAMEAPAGNGPLAAMPSAALALPLVIALAVGFAGLGNQFTLDDVALIQDNARVHSLANWPAIVSSPYWPPPWREDLYRPLMSLLHAVQYAVGGGSVFPFRLVSMLLYLSATLSVMRCAQRVLGEDRGHVRSSLLAGVLFAAHPIHVEAVAQAVNQGELLITILACELLVTYVDARRQGPLSRAQWTRCALIIVAACLIKEHGLVFPGLLIVTEVLLVQAPDERWRWPHWKPLLPGLAACSAGVAAVLLVRRAVIGDLAGSFTAETLVGLSMPQRALTMLQVVPEWARLLLWPQHLRVDYGPDEFVASTGFGVREGLGLALLAAVVVTAWRLQRRHAVLTWCTACAAVALFPVSNVIVPSGILLAERTLCLTSAFFVIAVAALLAPTLSPGSQARRSVVAAVAVLAVLGVARSVRRQSDWRNPVQLWKAASLEAPRSRRIAKARHDATESLIADFDARAASSDTPWVTLRESASLLHAMGDDSAAVRQFRRVVELHPDRRAATIDYAILLASLHRTADAQRARDDAVRLGADAASLARIDALLRSKGAGDRR